MHQAFKKITALALSLAATSALAAPTYLVTHNLTNVESNAYIGGNLPSPRPTAPHSDKQVHWAIVKIACVAYAVDGVCSALVKMATNTNNPVELGWINLNLNTGELDPKQITNNGYTLTVNGPAEVTLTEK